jgi:pyridinium-3,5-biscarboxylic acid mononucleotide synthase
VIRERALALLREVAAGSLEPQAALDALSFAPAEALGFATIDHHRALRQGYPEVIYAPGKTPGEIVGIAERLADRGDGFLVTRADEARQAAVAERFLAAEVNTVARTVYLAPAHQAAPAGRGTVLVVTAGTSDAPVAEEAVVTARAFGTEVARATDVGVAGLHRLLAHGPALQQAAVVIVVAGMDGALPSVIGGLVSAPVIAVPTSVGYGASYGGLAALLSMLNSCAAGVTVVNVDNGFGAAVAASRILHGVQNSH